MSTRPPRSVRARVLLWVGLTGLALSVLLGLPLRLVIGHQRQQQAVARADHHIEQTRAALQADLESLAATASDYAASDDAVAFVTGALPEYGDRRLILPMFRRLGVTACIVTNGQGARLFGAAVDSGATNFRPVPVDIGVLKLPDQPFTGTVAAEDGVYLVAASPIRPSMGGGPSVGHLLMARLLDDAEIARLAKRAATPLVLVRPPVTSPPEAGRVEWPIRDGAGHAIATLRIDQPLDADIDLRLLAVTWLLSWAVFGVAIVLIVEWLVLRRLRALSADVEQVSLRADHSLRVEVTGADELTDLAVHINHTLESAGRLTCLLEQAREVLRNAFGQYLSKEVAAAVLSNPDGLHLGGGSRELTVLFSDIRSYSTISEKLPPAEVVSLLNEYFGAMSAEIDAEGGTIIEFLGDAILAVFNAPNDVAQHEAHAVRAALAMRRVTEALNQKWMSEGRSAAWIAQGVDRLESRIGVHRGRVVAGNLGSPTRMKYAVIGDTVNTTSRVEGLNNALGTDILITEPVYQNLPEEMRGSWIDLGEHAVKGRAHLIRVFATTQRATSTTAPSPGSKP